MIGILIGVVGAAIVAGGIWWNGHKVGYASAEDDYKPKLEAEQVAKAKAIAANETLQADVDKARGLAQACEVKVTALQTLDADAKRSIDDSIARALARQKQDGDRLARQASAAATPSNKTPEQKCAAADATLGELADRTAVYYRDVLGMEPAKPAALPATAPPAEPPKSGPQPPKPAATPSKPLPSAVRIPKR